MKKTAAKKAMKKAVKPKVQRKAAPAARKPKPSAAAARKVQRKTASSGVGADLAGLPPKQRIFVLGYLANGFNATLAAKDAGYSRKTADSQASRLLKNAKVAAVIAGRTEKACVEREITAKRVLDEIAKLAFFDPRRMFRTDGTLVPIHELDDDTAAAVAGLDVKTLFEDSCPVGELKKIKIADKGANLERLGRYLKLFTDKVEHTGVMGVQLITSVPRPQRK